MLGVGLGESWFASFLYSDREIRAFSCDKVKDSVSKEKVKIHKRRWEEMASRSLISGVSLQKTVILTILITVTNRRSSIFTHFNKD